MSGSSSWGKRSGVAALAAAALLAGCQESGPTTRPLTFTERQDKALADPMGYKPDFSKDQVSPGGIGELDKEGLKRDLKSVFNP